MSRQKIAGHRPC